MGFFFQAEDGIRDRLVTGVQTCALPIWEVLNDNRKMNTKIRSQLSSNNYLAWRGLQTISLWIQ